MGALSRQRRRVYAGHAERPLVPSDSFVSTPYLPRGPASWHAAPSGYRVSIARRFELTWREPGVGADA